MNRICNRSPIQNEKSIPSGQRIMPEARFTELPALSVDLRVWVSRSVSDTDDQLFFLPLNGKNRSLFYNNIFIISFI